MRTTVCLCLGALNSLLSAASAGETVPYDDKGGRWLLDARAVVSRNDVLYTTPSVEPWEAMPTGGGDLAAMVRFDGGVHLHLTKSDAWGFQAPPDAPLGSRFFNNVSPGHVYLDFGPGANDQAAKLFRQRLDLYHGRVVIRLGKEDGGPRLEIWGHPQRKILVVEVVDPDRLLQPPTVELSEWRPTMKMGSSSSTIHAHEVHTRPARPHLASTAMQDYFDASSDPMLGRGTAVIMGCPSQAPTSCSVDGSTAKMIVPPQRPAQYCLMIAAAVTTSGDPTAAARRELEEAMKVPLETLKAEHRAWWQDYWGKSFLRVCSPDKKADWLCAAYHVHLYTLGCVNRGPYPAKWDGGAGLMRRDERHWGLAEWVQEIRFTYMPLYAAGRLDVARGLTRHYSAMLPYLREQTGRTWGVAGLWIPETVLPWGHAEDFIFDGDANKPFGSYRRWVPDKAPYGRFEIYNPYIGFLFTAGPEICHHYLTYYRYSGDEAFLREEAYPVIRGVCEFLANLLRKEDDGRYHLEPANALETWWMVRDPADVLDGIRAIFPEFIRLAGRYQEDTELCTRCAAILAALPEPSLALWKEDGTIDPSVEVYAPAAAFGEIPGRHNSENPALYRIYPFGLSGIGSADYDLARRTFDRRICSLGNGWSMDAIWAARLGLREEACELLAQHAARYNRFRYGGWDSNDSRGFPGGLSVAPFTDAGGLSAFALGEILLQSHNGIVRVTPAVAASWSGVFQLRAEGGLLVAVDFRGQDVRFVEIRSVLGKQCTVESPWKTAWIVREGQREIIRGDGRTIRFKTRPGGIYVIERADNPLSEYRPAAIEDEPNQSSGLPGRPAGSG